MTLAGSRPADDVQPGEHRDLHHDAQHDEHDENEMRTPGVHADA